jgi:UDP-glucose 4-epimerase
LGDYYRIPADNRDLNYNDYFENGDVKKSQLEDYNSHNAVILSVAGIKEKLLNLDYVKKQVASK